MNGSVLDYLRALADLEEAGAPLRNGAIVGALNVTPPSVSQMMARLRREGLVEEPDPGRPRLTDAGRRMARRAVRRHRLIETWLVRSLDLDWTTAHEEAHELEHALSDRLEEALDRHLGRPRRDPHGAPIPGVDGADPAERLAPLASLADGASGVVARLRDRDQERLDYWASVGLTLGARVRRVSAAPYDGPVEIEIEGRTVHLGAAALDGVWVRTEETGL